MKISLKKKKRSASVSNLNEKPLQNMIDTNDYQISAERKIINKNSKKRPSVTTQINSNIGFENFLKAVIADQADSESDDDINKNLFKFPKDDFLNNIPKEVPDYDENNDDKNLLQNYETFKNENLETPNEESFNFYDINQSNPFKYPDTNHQQQLKFSKEPSITTSNSLFDLNHLSNVQDSEISLNNPNQLIPILESDTKNTSDSNNLFYSNDSNGPENDLRSTIVLKDGQNPSFRNIENEVLSLNNKFKKSIFKDINPKMFDTNDSLFNSNQFPGAQNYLLSKIQMAESFTIDQVNSIDQKKINESLLEIEKVKDSFKKKKKRDINKNDSSKLKRTLNTVLKPKSNKSKKLTHESERELDNLALLTLNHFQKFNRINDSTDIFNYIGDNGIDQFEYLPKVSFDNYLAANFSKAKKYNHSDESQNQPSKKIKQPDVVQKKSFIKDMLLQNEDEEDSFDDNEGHIQENELYEEIKESESVPEEEQQQKEEELSAKEKYRRQVEMFLKSQKSKKNNDISQTESDNPAPPVKQMIIITAPKNKKSKSKKSDKDYNEQKHTTNIPNKNISIPSSSTVSDINESDFLNKPSKNTSYENSFNSRDLENNIEYTNIGNFSPSIQSIKYIDSLSNTQYSNKEIYSMPNNTIPLKSQTTIQKNNSVYDLQHHQSNQIFLIH